MAIDFPASPNINDTHTEAGKTWRYDGYSWNLEVNSSGYTLPIATASALGGIKVGSRLTINAASGVLDADVQTSAQVQSDWNATTGLGEILNKPYIAPISNTAPTSGDILKWNGTEWAPGTDLQGSGGGGGGASSDPIGTIVMWSGAANAIPTGYQLCNGGASATTELQAIRANVPDLRDKFAIGAGSGYAVDATGGSADAVVIDHYHAGASHNHGLSQTVNISASGTTDASDVPHTHSIDGTVGVGSGLEQGDDWTGNHQPRTSGTATGTSHTHPFSFSTTANLTGSTGFDGTGNTTSVGVSGTGLNIPPYYALCYIIKNAATSSTDLTSFSVTSNAAGTAALSYDNSTGVFSYTPPDLSGYALAATSLNSLSDVDTSGAANGKILKYNGTSWVIGNDNDSGTAGSGSFSGLSDTPVQLGSAGQYLKMNAGGTALEWTNVGGGSGGGAGVVLGFDSVNSTGPLTFTEDTWTDTGLEITYTPQSTDTKIILRSYLNLRGRSDGTGGGGGSFNQTYNANASITIPTGVTDVTYTIHGSKGGDGGNSTLTQGSAPTFTNMTGGTGSRGQQISGVLNGVGGQTLELKVGTGGSHGNGASGAQAGGAAGIGYYNGGTGGNSGGGETWGTDASGGGGGSATVIHIGGTVLVVAGGGAGGGGAASNSGFTASGGGTSTSISTTLGTPTTGGTGGNGAGSNGGSGGGGGGAPRGFGGGATVSGNHIAGNGGGAGDGYYNDTYHGTAPNVSSSSDTAYITIAYTAPANADRGNANIRMLEGSTVVGEQQYLNWGAGDADVTEKEWQFTQYTEYNNTDTNQKTFKVQLYEETGELILNNSNGQSYFTLMEVDNNPSGGGGGGGGTTTLINNNADNRIITGSATTDTLEAESNATYDGSKLNINSTDGSGQSITASGIIKAGTHLEATGGIKDKDGQLGNSGQVLSSTGTQLDWIDAGSTGTVTQISTGTGLTGGPITTTGTISLDTTGVTPTSYTSPSSVTVDTYGRITGIISGTAGATSLNGLSDVSVGSPSQDQVLTFNGSNWVNQAPAAGTTDTNYYVSSGSWSSSTGQLTLNRSGLSAVNISISNLETYFNTKYSTGNPTISTDSGNAWHQVIFVDSSTNGQQQLLKMDNDTNSFRWNASTNTLLAQTLQSYRFTSWNNNYGSDGQFLMSGGALDWEWTSHVEQKSNGELLLKNTSTSLEGGHLQFEDLTGTQTFGIDVYGSTAASSVIRIIDQNSGQQRFCVNRSGAFGIGHISASYGSSGQVLISQGSGSQPIWGNLSSASSTGLSFANDADIDDIYTQLNAIGNDASITTVAQIKAALAALVRG